MYIEDKKQVGATKLFHYEIGIGLDLYFFIVKLTYYDFSKPPLIEIKRGVTFWDCKKTLNNRQKRDIKRMIERQFQ